MRIRWTVPAARDLTGICDYTKERISAEAARKLALRIHGAIDGLARFPYQGRPGRKPGTRELVSQVFLFWPYIGSERRL